MEYTFRLLQETDQITRKETDQISRKENIVMDFIELCIYYSLYCVVLLFLAQDLCLQNTCIMHGTIIMGEVYNQCV